ncbi:MAG: hypothetical protein HQL56_19010 [Magnetococcales bacterium]|nr:hypothetical protein [Magnetococcales bacterium]
MKILSILVIFFLPLFANAVETPDSAAPYYYENLREGSEPVEEAKDVKITEKTITEMDMENYYKLNIKEREYQYYTTILISVMAVITLICTVGGLIWCRCQSGDIIIGVGMITVIYGAVLLSRTSADQTQLTAAMGIFGTVAGYLFGRTGSGAPRPPTHPSGEAAATPTAVVSKSTPPEQG